MEVKLEAGAETSRDNLLMDKKNVIEIERDESDNETKVVNRGYRHVGHAKAHGLFCLLLAQRLESVPPRCDHKKQKFVPGPV